MLELYKTAFSNLQAYAKSRRIVINRKLGHGKDGLVYLSSRGTALKAFRLEHTYSSEKLAYRRLRERGIKKIGIFNVPALENYDDLLWIIEMQMVRPPFIIDFVGAGIDRQPSSLREFSQEDWLEWHADLEDTFGGDWPEVSAAISTFRGQAGIYLYDLHRDNVRLR